MGSHLLKDTGIGTFEKSSKNLNVLLVSICAKPVFFVGSLVVNPEPFLDVSILLAKFLWNKLPTASGNIKRIYHPNTT